MYIVIMEWDGQKPPSKFYHRLRSMALQVRGNANGGKSNSPLVRRGGEEGRAVIFQEGCFITASESLARSIAFEAMSQTPSPTNVSFGTVDLLHKLEMTSEDAMCLARIENAFGKRGRPSGDDDVQQVIVCLEHMASFDVEGRIGGIANCPRCGSPNLKISLGTTPVFGTDPSLPLFENWVNTRFSGGSYTIPNITASGPLAPTVSSLPNTTEGVVVSVIGKSVKLLAFLATLEEEKALRFLDAILCGRCYGSDVSRREARVKAVTNALMLGIDPTKIRIAESDKEYDAFDGAYRYDNRSLLADYIQYVTRTK